MSRRSPITQPTYTGVIAQWLAMMVNVDPNYRWGILCETFWLLPAEIKDDLEALIISARDEGIKIQDDDQVKQNTERTKFFRVASGYVLNKAERLLQDHRYIIRDQGERVTLDDWDKLEEVVIEDQVDQG